MTLILWFVTKTYESDDACVSILKFISFLFLTICQWPPIFSLLITIFLAEKVLVLSIWKENLGHGAMIDSFFDIENNVRREHRMMLWNFNYLISIFRTMNYKARFGVRISQISSTRFDFLVSIPTTSPPPKKKKKRKCNFWKEGARYCFWLGV